MDDSSISLFANFCSSNMARYERVSKGSVNYALINQSSSTICASNSNIKNSTNLANSSENDVEKPPPVVQPKFDMEFNVWTKQDCEGMPGENGNRTWFYFGVRGGHGKWLKFNMMNLNKQGRLFEMGMLPVFKSSPGHEKWSRIYTKPTWQNFDNNFVMSFIHRIPEKKDTITYFAFCFPHSYDDCQEMLEKYDQKFEHCQNLKPEKCDPEDIYYHRELLAYSLDRRRIDLITISASNIEKFTREPRFDPDQLFPQGKNQRRCYSFERKKVFVLSSRVHPGETPASFIFNGFLEFILRKDDPRAKLLRRQFVFKLIPLLNPDGVARGHYRTDQTGTNLNRVYLNPDFNLHPSIYAVKSLLVFHHINNRISKDQDGLNFDNTFKLEFDKNETKELFLSEKLNPKNDETIKNYIETNRSTLKVDESCSSSCHSSPSDRDLTESFNNNVSIKDFQQPPIKPVIDNEKVSSAHLNDSKLSTINPLWSGIAFYVDLHAHAAKRGIFMYGNSIDQELYQMENVLYAKLIALSSQHFDFEGSNFSTKNMYAKDKREGLSKEGSGRVAIFKALGIIHSYTMEGCYASGRVMNTIAPAINSANHRTNNPRQDSGAISPALHSDIPPKLLIEHYADVGKALAIAALDIIELNPHSRIPNTSFGSLEALRNWIKFYIKSKNGGGFVSVATSKINTNNNNNSANGGEPQNSKKSVNQRFYTQQRINKLNAQSNARPVDLKNASSDTQKGRNTSHSVNSKSTSITNSGNSCSTFKRNSFKSKNKSNTPENYSATNRRKKSIIPTPAPSNIYIMDDPSIIKHAPQALAIETLNSIDIVKSNMNGNRNQNRNNIKLIKDLEITNSSSNSNIANTNLIKKNLSYQNQLRLKIASRKSNLLMKQLKGYERELTIDYQKEVIDSIDNINSNYTNEIPLNPKNIVDIIDDYPDFESRSKSKLTVRQLLPISRAGILQSNNKLKDNSLSNLSQNILLFNKLRGNGSGSANNFGRPNSVRRSSSRVNTPDQGESQNEKDILSQSVDSAQHHKNIILNSINRESATRKYLREFKHTNSSLSNYLKSENNGVKIDDDLLGLNNDLESQSMLTSSLALSMNKSQQKLLKKYSNNSDTPRSNVSQNNLVTLSFSTIDPHSYKKISK